MRRMSRFCKFAIAGPTGAAVPFQFIANDGNLVVNPILLTELDEQGIAERYDIVVDFSRFRVGDRLHLVNMLEADERQQARRRRDAGAGLAGRRHRSGARRHPAVPGRGVRCRASMCPGYTLTTANSCGSNDKSVVPPDLTDQIPIVTPVGRAWSSLAAAGNGDSRDPATGPVHARLLRGGVQLPLDHQRQRPDLALHERQPRLDGLSQGGRDRALDLHQ